MCYNAISDLKETWKKIKKFYFLEKRVFSCVLTSYQEILKYGNFHLYGVSKITQDEFHHNEFL